MERAQRVNAASTLQLFHSALQNMHFFNANSTATPVAVRTHP
jgi:hypothetical protein